MNIHVMSNLYVVRKQEKTDDDSREWSRYVNLGSSINFKMNRVKTRNKEENFYVLKIISKISRHLTSVLF